MARIAILGGGESGVGAARLAASKGFDVWVSDAGQLKPEHRDTLNKYGLPYEEGGHTWETIFESTEVIKSPGIPGDAPLVLALRERGIPIISEIEFAARFTDAKLIGITGTNGKTTTTLLTHHLMQAAGFDVGLAGNVGDSFAGQLVDNDHAWWVLELSSFQLDDIRDFRPDIALLLNITPDHLDRYDHSMHQYGGAKFRIGMNQRATDAFLYRPGDAWTAELLPEWSGKAERIAIPDAPDDGNFEKLNVQGTVFDLTRSALSGRHNWQNAAFALTAALRAGAEPQALQSGLETFRNAPHRMERVGTIGGVVFVNDSKATNVDATWFALDAVPGSIIWIAGGTDKGNDYGPLTEVVRQKVNGLICLGVDNDKLKKHFHFLEQIVEVESAAAAVQQALQWAQPGDTVLLAPACASFDRFRNYEDRGDQFRQAVVERVKSKG